MITKARDRRGFPISQGQGTCAHSVTVQWLSPKSSRHSSRVSVMWPVHRTTTSLRRGPPIHLHNLSEPRASCALYEQGQLGAHVCVCVCIHTCACVTDLLKVTSL